MTHFEYISVAVAIVLSLAVVRLLDAIPHVAAAGRRYWVHGVWVAFLLLWSALFWWLSWSHSAHRGEFDFGSFLFIITPPGLLYLAATTLVSAAPSEIDSHHGARRRGHPQTRSPRRVGSPGGRRPWHPPARGDRPVNLNQVTVPCADFDASVAFYRRLGLRLIVSDPPDYARFECPVGDATFSLHRVPHAPGDHGIVVYFELEDLDAKVRELAAAGLRFESAPQDQPWLWREAYLRDPAGNRICLFHAGGNRHDPPWRLPSDG